MKRVCGFLPKAATLRSMKPAPLTPQPDWHHLPRLAPEFYRGFAVVQWTITIKLVLHRIRGQRHSRLETVGWVGARNSTAVGRVLSTHPLDLLLLLLQPKVAELAFERLAGFVFADLRNLCLPARHRGFQERIRRLIHHRPMRLQDFGFEDFHLRGSHRLTEGILPFVGGAFDRALAGRRLT